MPKRETELTVQSNAVRFNLERIERERQACVQVAQQLQIPELMKTCEQAYTRDRAKYHSGPYRVLGFDVDSPKELAFYAGRLLALQGDHQESVTVSRPKRLFLVYVAPIEGDTSRFDVALNVSMTDTIGTSDQLRQDRFEVKRDNGGELIEDDGLKALNIRLEELREIVGRQTRLLR